MPPQLQKGLGTVRANVTALMQPARSQSRKRAIVTLSKKRNISRKDAQFVQAQAIARTQARKK